MHCTHTGDPHVAYGEHDLWNLWLLEEAERVPIHSTNIRLFLHYLYSDSTQGVTLHSGDRSRGRVGVKLMGPKADDGYNHTLDFRLDRDNVWTLGDFEREGMIVRLSRFLVPTPAGLLHSSLKTALSVLNVSVSKDVTERLKKLRRETAGKPAGVFAPATGPDDEAA